MIIVCLDIPKRRHENNDIKCESLVTKKFSFLKIRITRAQFHIFKYSIDNIKEIK